MNQTTHPLVPVSPLPVPAVIDDAFIKSRIHTIRDVQVMLSPDLADLYQVETRAFNQAVKRNEERFPPSFRFQLTKEELREVITNCDNPDRLRFSPQTPYAFTEQGVAMLSGILNSAVAVRTSIRIMEAFVAMRLTRGRGSAILRPVSHTEHWSMPACRLPPKRYDGERGWIVDSKNPRESATGESRHIQRQGASRELRHRNQEQGR